MIKLSTKKTTLLNFAFLVATYVSCGSDDGGETPALKIDDYKANITAVTDVGDNGNASDISVSFSAAISNNEISEYRIIYQKTSSATEVTAVLAKALNASNYSVITTVDQNTTVTLNAEQLSFDGEALVQDEEYRVYVLSIGTFNGDEVLALSDVSANFKIVDTNVLDIANYTTQITSVSDVGNNGNASDIAIIFDGASASSMIQEYRLIIAKSTSASQVNLESVKTLATDRYTSIANEKSNYEITLAETQLDFEGAAIASDIKYQVFVLTIGSFKEEPVYALSIASSEFELIQKIETNTLVADFKGNDALSIDADGNLYVSNYGVYQGTGGNGTAALKVTPAGDVTEFVSNLTGPLGNAIDDSGNFYVNNGNNNTSADLLKIAPDGTQTIIATLAGFPSGMLIGTDDSFYVTNFSEPVINKVTPDGTVTTFASDSKLNGGVGIVYDDNGNILVGNFLTGDILSVNPSGQVSVIATIPTVQSGFVIGYITYFEGNIYATGYGANIIYKVSLGGTVTEFAGNGTKASVDGELADASFITPNGITIDKARRLLYISENGNGGGLRSILLE